MTYDPVVNSSFFFVFYFQNLSFSLCFQQHNKAAAHLWFVNRCWCMLCLIWWCVPSTCLILCTNVKIYRWYNLLWLAENEWIHMCALKSTDKTREDCVSMIKWTWYVIKNAKSPSGCHLFSSNESIKIMSFVYVIECATMSHPLVNKCRRPKSDSARARTRIIEMITIMFIREICHG